MPEIRYNLLEEPLLSVETGSGSVERLSLPDVLQRLGRAEPIEFAALQPHQMHAWHALLVQLAAIAIHAAGGGNTARSAAEWRAMLRALAAGRDEAFCLVVEDLSQPAFMQPPVPEGHAGVLKNDAAIVDAFDILVTAKNHDVKALRIARPSPEHWMYVLVGLQTMEGFLGAGNYGISRMNGGFASRPCVAVAREPGTAARFIRDVEVCLNARSDLAQRYDYPLQGGHALLWLLPWDGESSLSLRDLDPLYVEVCRRVRLFIDSTGIKGRRTTTKCARIHAKDALGDTGDPWTPIHRQGNKALTVDASGFNYKRMQELLFSGDWADGAAAKVQAADGATPVVVASVLVRGQGETGGYHERLLPIPAKARPMFATREGREKLGAISKAWVDVVTKIRNSILKPALLALLQAGPDKLNFDDRRADPWITRLDPEVDRIFFENLFAAIDRDRAEADRAFIRSVLDFAQAIFEDAVHSVPVPLARRPRAVAAADRTFHGASRKQFPDLFPPKGEPAHDPTAAQP